ncbi:Subito [Operophtera brumata]|uniref:Subito n=1 Tax=Operophtera brumata TaxID=104452 RepID=A0A0L7L6X9_OPEBR|nr:Subito [Operophtera brumata]
MVAGKHSLVVAETGIHAQSSRSHCILTITMLSETVILVQRDGGRQAQPGGGGDRHTRAVFALTLHTHHHYALGDR